MKKSFTVVAERLDPEPGYDGLLAVFNAATVESGTRIAITDVRAQYSSGFNSDQTNILGNQGILSLDRITATSGGTAIAASKYDTGASSLPGQVTCSLYPTSVTQSATLRRFGDSWAQTILLANNFGSYRAPNVLDSNDHSGRTSESCDVWHADGVSDTEPLVLNEGQGLAVIKRAYGVCMSHHWRVILTVAATGSTYIYNIFEAGDPYCIGDPFWSVFNGSGSGVVLKVMVVSMPDIGESNIPKFRLARSRGLTWGGLALTPVVHDTANTVPEVAAYEGPFTSAPAAEGITMNYLGYQNTPVTTAEQQRAGNFRNFMIGTIWTETAPPNFRTYMPDEVWPGERRMAGTLENDAIWLDPNEGLVVLGGGGGTIETSQAATVNVEIVGYVVTPNVTQARARYALGV